VCLKNNQRFNLITSIQLFEEQGKDKVDLLEMFKVLDEKFGKPSVDFYSIGDDLLIK
jgi:hypothetical protein